MDQREQALMEQEQQQKENQIQMVSENPIEEERNQGENEGQRASIEAPQLDQNIEMQEEKLNQQDDHQEINQENENEQQNDEDAVEQQQPIQVQQQGENQHEEQDQQQIDNQVEVEAPIEGQPEERKSEQIQKEQNKASPQINIKNQQEELQPENQIEQAQQQAEEQLQNNQEPKQNIQIPIQKQPQNQIYQQPQINNQLSKPQEPNISIQSNPPFISNSQEKRAQQNYAYINKLENMIENLRDSLNKTKNQQNILTHNNKKLSQEIASIKSNSFQIRKRKMQLELQKNKLNKDYQKLKKQNIDYKQKLSEIQKIGNILVLKNTIQELNLLTNSQRQEIRQLKEQASKERHNYYQQQLQILQTYQNQINNFQSNKDSLQLTIKQLQKQRNELRQLLDSHSQQNEQLKYKIDKLQQQLNKNEIQIISWNKKWQSIQQQRTQYRKSRQLQQKVSQYQSQRFIGQDNDLPLLSTLSDKQQKNLLLKQYLKLQTIYQQIKIKYQQTQLKLKRLLRDTKIQQSNTIRKKDYLDLLGRYKKAKNCLESAFLQIKKLQRQQSNPVFIRQQVNQLLEGNEARLCHQIIKNTNQQHLYINQKINQMQLNQQIILLKTENKNLKNYNIIIQKQLKDNQKIISLMNNQIQIKRKNLEEKSNIIQRLIQNGYSYTQQNYKGRIQQLQNQVNMLNQHLSVHQVKNLLLIRENQSYLQQISHWKGLYDNIKQKLNEKINHLISESQKPFFQNRQQFQNNFYCQECEKRSLIQVNNTQLQEYEVQTQTNYDLQYSEIKQCLLSLKKINKQVEIIPQSHQKTVKFITEFKEKYEKYIQVYNAKIMELKKNIAENEAWRAQAKVEIRKQFQDIRDIISNNKLLTALRQAKSLIDYLQNEQDKGGQQQQNNDGRLQDVQQQNNEGEQK